MSLRLFACVLLSSTIGLTNIACSANDVKLDPPDTARQSYEFIDLSNWTPIEELPVIITFLRSTPGDENSPYCPRFVDRPFIRLVDWEKKTYVKKVVWRAEKADGNAFTDGFSLYFSPFDQMPDGKTGFVESAAIPRDFVTLIRRQGYDVEFKYTVVGDDCRRDPLDPRMRVD